MCVYIIQIKVYIHKYMCIKYVYIYIYIYIKIDTYIYIYIYHSRMEKASQFETLPGFCTVYVDCIYCVYV